MLPSQGLAGLRERSIGGGRHTALFPDTCYVCEYLSKHIELNLDVRLEHTLTYIAQSILLEDLEEAGQPLPFEGLAVSGIGEPGPVTQLEPRHWYWALITERSLVIGLRQQEGRQ